MLAIPELQKQKQENILLTARPAPLPQSSLTGKLQANERPYLN